MKTFKFSLEKILDLRKHFENEAKIELGRAVSVLAELESRLYALGAERDRAAAAQFSPGNNAALMQQYMFYLLRLDNEKEALLKETAMAELKVEEARNAYIEASRDRKVLDKLKEKRQNEYARNAHSEEAMMLDDITSCARAQNLIAEMA